MSRTQMAEPLRPAGLSEATAAVSDSRWRLTARLISDYRTEFAIAVAILILEGIVGILVPNALTQGNLADIGQAASPLVIMAIGQLLVVITGGIDLSVGSVFSLTGMVTALAMAHHFGPVTSSVLGLGVGVLTGLVNGLLVTVAGLAPFVVTLITYAACGSLAFIVTNGQSLPVPDQSYYLLNSGAIIPGVVNYALFCVILLIGCELFLKRAVAGRWLYAVGSNANASRLLGVPVRRIVLAAYLGSGILAAFASLLSLSYISNAEATAGSSLMLQAIAAVVIGGASLFGGTGSAIGAVLGALMITAIQNGVNLIGVNSFWQGSVTAIVILIAVLVDRIGKAQR
ncbi:MAG TPA: ABC transporter permease [Acetobacteraceae bacterium]|jgi:ribose transport system permease protein|nr:ABC transporter permease [Acetobacteraceae bacterium]